jgi:hypothetical protein
MTHHIGIFYDRFSKKLYAAPGKAVVGRGDRLILHAVNTEIIVSTRHPEVIRFESELKLKRGEKIAVTVPTNKKIAPAGVYTYRAYSTKYKVHAIGGSYPKVIIYD